MPNGNDDEHIDYLTRDLNLAEERIRDLMLVLTPQQETSLTTETQKWIAEEKIRQQESARRKENNKKIELLKESAISKLTEEELNALSE